MSLKSAMFGVVCSPMKLNIIFNQEYFLLLSIMNTLETPDKEELLQELLAFKHLAAAPECMDDIAFKVQLLSLDSEFQKQLYISYWHRDGLHIDTIIEESQKLVTLLKLTPPLDSQSSKNWIIKMRGARQNQLLAQYDQLQEIIALDRAEMERVAKQMGYTQQNILKCIAMELKTFKKVQEKEGKAFRYSDISEEELRNVAEKRFGKALEAVKFVQEKEKKRKNEAP